MSLRITARLDRDAVVAILDELLPVTIDVSADPDEPGERWIRIDKARQVDFAVSEGLRVQTNARIQWKAAGLRIPTTADVLLVLRPTLATDDRGGKLVFQASVQHADFKHMPAFVDRRLTGRINQALATEGDLLAWHFGESLALKVAMPPNMSPLDAFELRPGTATVQVFDDALELSLMLALSFVRRPEEPSPVTETAADGEEQP